ncbi:MAG: hypothetical protein K8R99_11105 [Actinomycetia bacterium]|nr:hypothetical protein [Actinomycetes bacterium]
MNHGADQSPAVRWLGVSRERLLRGALAGGAAGVLAACAWFAVVAGTTQRQAYLIPVVGAAVAYGVHKGMRGFGRAQAIVSVAITAVAVVITMYYVERLLVVRWFAESGDHAAIPLVPYLDWFWSVLRRAFTISPSPAVYTVGALLAAGWLGHQGFEAPPARHHDA